MASRLENRVAVVTGASTAIGRGVALCLAAEGAAVVVNDSAPASAERVEAVAAEIHARGGAAMADTEPAEAFDGAARIIDAAVGRYGRIDILVTTSGPRPDGTVADVPQEDWNANLSGRLRAAFHCSRHAGGRMRERKSGRIVFLASAAGWYGASGRAGQAAADDGIAGLTRVVSRDLGKYGVTVNAVATTDAGDPTAIEVESAASFVAYLAGDAAAGINGQMFVVNGNAVSLLNYPAPVRTITRLGRWTPEEIAETFPSTLGLDLVNPARRHAGKLEPGR